MKETTEFWSVCCVFKCKHWLKFLYKIVMLLSLHLQQVILEAMIKIPFVHRGKSLWLNNLSVSLAAKTARTSGSFSQSMLRSTINSNNWRTLLQSRCLRRILYLLHPLLSSKLRSLPIGRSHWRRRAVTRTRRRRCPSGWCWSCFQFLVQWWRCP